MRQLNTLKIPMKYRMILYCIRYKYTILIVIYTMIKEGYNCIYHISLCKYYTVPMDPGIFCHDRSKTFFIKQPDLQIFGTSVGPNTNLNIFILKTDAVKKTPNTVVMHYFLFLLHQSLNTLYVH